MDIRTGKIYDNIEDAIGEGVPEDKLVTATHRETLEELRRNLNLNSKYEPHQGTGERERRLKKVGLKKVG